VTVNRSDATTLDLRPFVLSLIAARRWVLIGTLLGMAAGAFAWWGTERTFEAVVTLSVNQPRDSAAVNTTSSYRALLENQTIAAQALKHAGLDQGRHPIAPSDFLRYVLNVEELRGTNLIRLRVRLPAPDLAASVANDIATRAEQLSRDVNQAEGQSMRDQLKSQRDEIAERLATAETALLDFKRKHAVSLLRAEVESLVQLREELAGVDVDLASARAGAAATEKEQKLRPPIIDLRRSLDSDPTLTEAARAQGADAKSLARLSLTTQQSNPVFERLDEDMARFRARVAELERRRQQILTSSEGAKSSGKLAELLAQEIEEQKLTADHALARAVYEDVAMRYEQARVIVTSGSPRLQVVDTATAPTRPVSWPIWIWMALGAVVGAVVPIGVALGSTATRLIGGALALPK